MRERNMDLKRDNLAMLNWKKGICRATELVYKAPKSKQELRRTARRYADSLKIASRFKTFICCIYFHGEFMSVI